jgi:hypothetical protein
MSHQFWRALCFPSSPRPLCRWPGKERLIRPTPESGNATNINHFDLHAIWVRPSITQATAITKFIMSVVPKPRQGQNTLAMTYLQRAWQDATQQKQSCAKPCTRKKSRQYIWHDWKQTIWHHLRWAIYFAEYYASLLHQDPCADGLARKGLSRQVPSQVMQQPFTMHNFLKSEQHIQSHHHCDNSSWALCRRLFKEKLR